MSSLLYFRSSYFAADGSTIADARWTATAEISDSFAGCNTEMLLVHGGLARSGQDGRKTGKSDVALRDCFFWGWLRDPEPHEQKGRGDAKICLVVANGKTKFKGTVNSAKDTTDVLQGTPSRRPVNPDCARAARSGSTFFQDVIAAPIF